MVWRWLRWHCTALLCTAHHLIQLQRWWRWVMAQTYNPLLSRPVDRTIDPPIHPPLLLLLHPLNNNNNNTTQKQVTTERRPSSSTSRSLPKDWNEFHSSFWYHPPTNDFAAVLHKECCHHYPHHRTLDETRRCESRTNPERVVVLHMYTSPSSEPSPVTETH